MDYPATFTDALGRPWTVQITVGTLPRLKAVAKFELDDIMPDEISDDVGLEPLAKFLASPIRVLNVVYAACKPQIDAKGLTFDQFCEGLEGEKGVEVCMAMGGALFQAIVDFFLKGSLIPQERKAATLKRALTMGKTLMAVDARRAVAMLDQVEAKAVAQYDKPLTAEEKAAIDAELEKAFSKRAGNTPAPSGSPTLPI